MFRRTIALALAGLAIAAPPALAHSHWNSQMKDAAQTASRSAGGCTIKAGSWHGSLVVSCDSSHQATLTYGFPIGRSGQGGGGIQGTPWCGLSRWGRGPPRRQGLRRHAPCHGHCHGRVGRALHRQRRLLLEILGASRGTARRGTTAVRQTALEGVEAGGREQRVPLRRSGEDPLGVPVGDLAVAIDNGFRAGGARAAVRRDLPPGAD